MLITRINHCNQPQKLLLYKVANMTRHQYLPKLLLLSTSATFEFFSDWNTETVLFIIWHNFFSIESDYMAKRKPKQASKRNFLQWVLRSNLSCWTVLHKFQKKRNLSCFYKCGMCMYLEFWGKKTRWRARQEDENIKKAATVQELHWHKSWKKSNIYRYWVLKSMVGNILFNQPSFDKWVV